MSDDNLTPIFERDIARIAHVFTYREIKVLELLYGLHGKPQQSFDEIARGLGVTSARIRQIQARAVSMIRDLPPEAC